MALILQNQSGAKVVEVYEGLDVNRFSDIVRDRNRIREWFTNVVTMAGKVDERLEVLKNAVATGARKAPSGRARRSA